MYQFLMDNSDLHALTALYVSIYLGIILKFLWAWSVEDSFMESQANPTNTKIYHPLFLYKKKSRLNGSFILYRIVKYIRRKVCPQDEPEAPISFSFY